jgi:flagellar FliL protein
MKKIIIIVVVVLVLAGGGGAAFMLMGGDEAGAQAGASDAAGAAEVVIEEPERDPIYLPLSPAFVVNFEHKGSIRYLQLTLQVMSYHQEVVDKVDANMPAVRNKLIMLFSGQDYDALNTSEGKENLRKEVLTSIEEVLRLKGEMTVSDVYFTGFVMQ